MPSYTCFHILSAITITHILWKPVFYHYRIVIFRTMEKLQPNKTLTYNLVILLLFVLRITDLTITYIYTPDLNHEFNPMVSFFGASWSTFLLFQFLLFCMIATFIYFFFFHERFLVDIKGLPFSDFIYYYFHGEIKPFHKRFTIFPRYYRRHLAFNGFVLMILSIATSIYAIIHNTMLINEVEWYIRLIHYHYRQVFSLLLLSGIIISVYSFFLMEYNRYRYGKQLY